MLAFYVCQQDVKDIYNQKISDAVFFPPASGIASDAGTSETVSVGREHPQDVGKKVSPFSIRLRDRSYDAPPKTLLVFPSRHAT